MSEALKNILEIQELDVKMIRLMRLKRERQKELDNIQSIKNDCHHQLMVKEGEIIDLKKEIRMGEADVDDVSNKIKDLETKQNSVKKVDEFNALSREIAQTEREKAAKEQRVSDLIDKLSSEEEVLGSLKETLESTQESSAALEEEIQESIRQINAEGRELKEQRDGLAKNVEGDILKVYERLLKNKRDRVVVPIENRTCSGCHIVLTAQHENMVRKGERIVFCEHCSRIHYWPESDVIADTAVATKRRRRPTATKS